MSTMRMLLAMCAVSMAAWGQAAHPAQRPHPVAPKPGTPRVGQPLREPPRPITVRDATFQSTALGREMHYRILLPAGYDASPRRYPVVYLLHGLWGSYVDWESRTHLDEDAAGRPVIIAMPDADDSWYTNSASDPQAMWEDYIVKDFIPYIDKTYRTIQTRHARAIAGLSMGGYGAMKLALKYPGMFIFAGSMSGALDVAKSNYRGLGEKFAQQIAGIYGPADSPNRATNDPYALAAKVANPASLPYLWLACGTEDGLVAANHEFIELLVKQKIPHFYEESAGAHNWKFWDEHLPPMLSLLMKQYFVRDAVYAMPSAGLGRRKQPTPLHR